MKVLQFDNFAVYIYADHAPPHCHLRFSDGADMIVSLPNLNSLTGDGKRLKKVVKELLIENIDFLCTKWDELN
jgi:hypothetical protein